MTKRIFLHGPLAERYGTAPFTFKADNARELFSALRVFCPGFLVELRKFSDVAIIKKRGDEIAGVPKDEFDLNFGNWDELHVIAGVKAAGATEFATWAATTFASGTTYYTAAYVAAYAVYAIAVNYAISAVIQSMQTTPKTESAKSANESSLFDGPENIAKPGARVQLNYGEFRVGSVTINQKMTAIRQALAANDSVSLEEGKTASINILTNDYFATAPTIASFVINGVTTAVGGTYVTGTRSFQLLSTGVLNITAGTGAASYLITVNATDSGADISQTVAVTITAKRTVYVSSSSSSYSSSSYSSGSSGSGWSQGGGDAAGVGTGEA